MKLCSEKVNKFDFGAENRFTNSVFPLKVTHGGFLYDAILAPLPSLQLYLTAIARVM